MPGRRGSERASSSALKMNETSFLNRFSVIYQLINVIIIRLHANMRVYFQAYNAGWL